MTKIVETLEVITHAVQKSDAQAKINTAISTLKDSIQKIDKQSSSDLKNLLGQLDKELTIWQTKLDVILKEPVGRKGLSKHAEYWIEQLRKVVK